MDVEYGCGVWVISCAHDACESHDTGRRGVPTVTNYTNNNEIWDVM